MMNLPKAIMMASLIHKDQKDKGGNSYILHPIHVMMKLKECGATEDELIVAVLHDAIEDSENPKFVEEKLKYHLTEYQFTVLKLLTHNPEDDYLEVYIKNIKKNPLARKIKIADLEHNMDIRRLKNRSNIQEKDLQRIKKYAIAYELLAG